MKEEDKHRVREQVKDCFRNGSFLDDRWLNRKISLSLNDRRNHVREKMRTYLINSKDSPQVIREKGCPAEFDAECWAAWIEDELKVRAWANRRHWQIEIQEGEADQANGKEVDLMRVRQKYAKWD